MKTIVLFGASGKTGKEIINLALKNNFTVKAFCRNKNSVTFTHANLSVIEGDLLAENNVNSSVQGVDYVISAIGTKPPYNDVFCYEALKNIIVSMYNFNVRRLTCITGAMIGDYHERLSYFVRYMKKKFNKKYPQIAVDRLKQELAVKASGLDWTIVKPFRLTNGSLSRYKIGGELNINLFDSVSRKTVASFIIDSLNDNSTFQKAIFVKK